MKKGSRNSAVFKVICGKTGKSGKKRNKAQEVKTNLKHIARVKRETMVDALDEQLSDLQQNAVRFSGCQQQEVKKVEPITGFLDCKGANVAGLPDQLEDASLKDDATVPHK